MSDRTPHVPGGIREMLTIALPMIVSMSCDTLMTFTDRLYLSRLGPVHMDAAMGGGLFSFLFLTLIFGLIDYTAALVAQHFGANEKNRTSLAVTQAIILSLVAWPILIALRPVAHMAFVAAGIPEAQRLLQIEFFDILVLGSGISLMRVSISGFFTGIGRTRIVMASTMTALAVNAGLSWVLIFGHFGLPALGIRGAAFGTVAGGLAGFIVLLSSYLRPAIVREFGLALSARFDRISMGRLMRYGSPAGLELFLNLLSFNCIVMLFHAEGAITATAATIMFNWDMVAFLPLIGIEIAVTSLVGRYVGAGRPELARKAAYSGLSLTWGYAAVVFVFFLGAPELLVSVFTPAMPSAEFSAAVPLAVFMLRIAALYVFVNGVMVVFAGALRGAGDTLWCMLFMVAMHWILVAGLFIALRVLHLGPRIGWAVVVALFMSFPFVLWRRWQSGKWQGRIAGPEAALCADPSVVADKVACAEEGFRSGRDL